MATRDLISADEAQELLSYNPDTGILTWNVNRKRCARAGQSAGSLKVSGYIVIGIYKKMYYAHRMAWFLHHGEWPKYTIDHINRNRSDNRIANLRDVNIGVNSQNSLKSKLIELRSMGETDLPGVEPSPNMRSWHAAIEYKGKKLVAKGFKTAEEAHAMYVQLEKLVEKPIEKNLPSNVPARPSWAAWC